jgi:hypothetical protein
MSDITKNTEEKEEEVKIGPGERETCNLCGADDIWIREIIYTGRDYICFKCSVHNYFCNYCHKNAPYFHFNCNYFGV